MKAPREVNQTQSLPSLEIGELNRTARWLLPAAFGILLLSLGVRQALGPLLAEIARGLQLSEATISFAFGMQNLIWGFAQPLAGWLADRYGARRVLFYGAATYALGLSVAANATSEISFMAGLGVLSGLGLGATTYAVVLGALARAKDALGRVGVASLGGAVGIFLAGPFGAWLAASLDWRLALMVMALLVAAAVPLAGAFEGKPPASQNNGSDVETVGLALRTPGFWLLMIAFSVCGFQLAAIATHLPNHVLLSGGGLELVAVSLAVIGAANILGVWLAGKAPTGRLREVLAMVYTSRALAFAPLLLLPLSPASLSAFSLLIGLAWLATVPLTSALVSGMFAPLPLSALMGLVFLLHQLGAFAGAWLPGVAKDATGSYAVVWQFCVVLSLISAGLHLLIRRTVVVQAADAPS